MIDIDILEFSGGTAVSCVRKKVLVIILIIILIIKP